MAPQPDVIENRHPLEELNLLEGPGDAQVGSPMWTQVIDTVPFIEDITFLGMVETGDAVEHHRLASTVGSDNGMDLAALYFKRDVRQGADPTEIHAHIMEPQQDLAVASHLRITHGLCFHAHVRSLLPTDCDSPSLHNSTYSGV